MSICRWPRLTLRATIRAPAMATPVCPGGIFIFTHPCCLSAHHLGEEAVGRVVHLSLFPQLHIERVPKHGPHTTRAFQFIAYAEKEGWRGESMEGSGNQTVRSLGRELSLRRQDQLKTEACSVAGVSMGILYSTALLSPLCPKRLPNHGKSIKLKTGKNGTFYTRYSF